MKNEITEARNRDHFFVLYVHEDRSLEPAYLVAIKAPDEFEARRLFPNMRPKSPIMDPKNFNILDAYDTEDMSDMIRLKCHQRGRKIIFYIEKTKIDTLFPHNVSISVDDIWYRKEETKLIHLFDKGSHKVVEDKLTLIEDKLQKGMLTMKTNTVFYTEKNEGRLIIDNSIELKENMSFILYNKTLGEVIEFARMVYKIAEGSNSILEFYYYENESLYSCNFGEDFYMKKM